MAPHSYYDKGNAAAFPQNLLYQFRKFIIYAILKYVGKIEKKKKKSRS